MNQRKITNMLLLALLVFNIGFIGSWWYGHMKAHRMMEGHDIFTHHESKGAAFMARELGFSDEQKTKLEELRKAHFEKIEKLSDGVARCEKMMMGTLTANPADSAKANIYADSVGMYKASIQKEIFAHFNSVKKMCTPEQQSKFEKLAEEMTKEFPHHWDMHHGSAEMHHDSM